MKGIIKINSRYAFYLWELFESDKEKDLISLEGHIYHHFSTCSRRFESCNCDRLLLELKRSTNIDHTDSYYEFYEFLIMIFNENIRRFPKSYSSYLNIVYIQHLKHKRRFPTIWQIHETLYVNLSLRISFLLYCYMLNPHIIQMENGGRIPRIFRKGRR